MAAPAIDTTLSQQGCEEMDGDRGLAEHSGANAGAEGARLGNHTDDDQFGRGVTHNPQLRERLLKPWIMGRQTKLDLMRQKVSFAIGAQRSRCIFRFDSIRDYDQVLTVQVRRQIQPRCAQVKDLDVRGTFVLATERFHRQGAETVIPHQHVPQSDHADMPRRQQGVASLHVHKTFT